jgi:exonuclease VII large subunit
MKPFTPESATEQEGLFDPERKRPLPVFVKP